MANADLGAAYAVGAHGLQRDLALAERHLRVGAQARDAEAMANLGVLLLEQDR